VGVSVTGLLPEGAPAAAICCPAVHGENRVSGPTTSI
jgi:hypothetical protein